MHALELRLNPDQSSPQDLQVNVQEKTYEYLMTTLAHEIRVSAYLDRAWPQVEARYAELVVSENLKFKVASIGAGSKTRKIILPDEMHEGEQLILVVTRHEPVIIQPISE